MASSSHNLGRRNILSASKPIFRLWSVRIMLVVGLIFLLQVIPFTGVFLMFMLASLWSAPLINLAVLVAGFEALTGRIPRWFVLLPVCWFGLYAIAFWREEAGLVEAQSSVQQRNAAARPLVYDPARFDLVLQGQDKGLVGSRVLDRLLLRHRVPAVYHLAGRFRDRMSATRLATDPLCETLEARTGGADVEVLQLHPGNVRHLTLDSSTPLCLVTLAEEPAREIFRIARSEETESFGGLDVRMFVTSAEAGGERSEIRGASASVLQPLPIPVLGCALNSGAPSWDCFADFMRQRRVWFGTKLNEAKALEMALDLSQAQPLSIEDANAALLDRLAGADRRHDRRRFDRLEAFLQDSDGFKDGHLLYKEFTAEPEKLSPYTDRLIAALETVDAVQQENGRSGGKAARALVALLGELPDREIRLNGARLLALLDGERRPWWNQARPLMRRTALLGEAALPMLIRRLEGHYGHDRLSWPEADAIIALCRLGAPAALPAAPKLLEIWQRRLEPQPRARVSETDETHLPLILDRADKNLYLALLRLGLRDQAGLPEPKGKSKWWPETWQSVSPESSAEVCEDTR